MDPEVVLEKSIIASKELQSVRFDGHMQFDNVRSGTTIASDGSLSFDGMMKNAGKQMLLNFDCNGNARNEAEDPLRFGGELMVLGDKDMYVFIDEIRFPGHSSLSTDTQDMLNKWWVLSGNQNEANADSLTPDPRLLRIQSEIVDILDDRGISSENGYDVIRYDVTLNKDKLASFLFDHSANGSGRTLDDIRSSIDSLASEGELSIDAETFVLRRIAWHLTYGDKNNGSSIDFDVEFSDHNGEMEISPPVDALPLPSDVTDFLPSLYSTRNDVMVSPVTEIYTTD